MPERKPFDFSRHQYTKTVGEIGGLKVARYSLTINGDRLYAVHLTNVGGECYITGDFYRWSMCREWHPDQEGYVSRRYLDEKVRASSYQKTEDFSEEVTLRLLNDAIEDCDESEETYRKFLEDCKGECGSRDEYVRYIEDFHPSGYDPSNVPFGYEREYYLDVVYDAFEEMIKREELARETEVKP